MSVTSSVRHILDIPDEILLEILRHLNARERAVFGNSSQRFNRLVFRDKKLLRDLDFSYEGRLTAALDIQPYFINEETNRHILKVNLRNVELAEPGRILNDYVGKALNLVDINIHGVELESLEQLVSFLKPLIFVERLSIDWPVNGVDDVANYPEIHQGLNQPFNRLTYLSVRTYDCSCLWEFLEMINMCQQLRELHIFHGNEKDDWGYLKEIEPLENLEIFEFCGYFASQLKDDFLELLPEPEIWTGFGLFSPLDEKCFRLERDVEVCEEIEESECIIDLPDSWEWTLGNRLRFDRLLGAVIKITQENIPKKFCVAELRDEEPCALKIDDAKLLLKNPRHQIKYLCLGESIGTECRVHRFSLAAPNLTELYLSDIMKIKSELTTITVSASKHTDFDDQNDPMNPSQLDSSFKMLVENTPWVKDLTLNGRPGQLEADEAWDLGALGLIQGWKNLKSLRLLSIPICDAEFLIEVGKQCDGLEKLEFYNLGPSSACCYVKQLSLMLTHCHNLTDFSMHAENIGLVSEVFVSLAKNLKLRKVRLRSSGEMNNTENLISSIQQLLRSCSNLNTFVCIIDGTSEEFSNQLTSILQRLRDELNRPSLQFQVVRKSDSNAAAKVDTVRENSLPPSFPYTWDEFSYM